MAQKLAEDEEELPQIKSIYFDLGYGTRDLSAAFGFRYWRLSASMGIAGFATNIPNYSRLAPQGVILRRGEPLPDGFTSEDYTAISVFGDFSYHHDLTNDWSFWGSVGFHSSRDTILARNMDDGQYYSFDTKGTEGITFGVGAEYILSDKFSFGLGLHSIKGIHGRVIITWF